MFSLRKFQTQSQELGAETVVDNEMLMDLGMVSFHKSGGFSFVLFLKVGGHNVTVGEKKQRKKRNADISWTQAPRCKRKNGN